MVTSRFGTGGFGHDSEMARLTRAFDWSLTPLGPTDLWPQSLKTAVRIMLSSRYAMWMGWGAEFTFLYNDAYASMTLGPKHPWALGRSAREVWAEIWPEVGPRAESVMATGVATWDEGLQLFLERHGFREETYHTFSYSPLPDDEGKVGGMLCVVTEDTERTIGERRLRTLRELAAATLGAETAEAACDRAARSLAGNPHDLPFIHLHVGDHVAKAGYGGDLSNAFLAQEPGDDAPLSIRAGPWPEGVRSAVLLPMGQVGHLIAGLNTRRPLDEGYRGFLALLSGQVSNAVSDAIAFEEAKRRAEALAEIDRAKTAFFSNVSHEFRTPLTLLLGPVEDILAKPDLPADDRERLEVAHRNARRLQKLVNSLLDFSRLEAGRAAASSEAVDLSLLTADLASTFRAACQKAGLAFVVDCPPLPHPVKADRGMWEKVVFNLLSNAFKYTLAGSIAVRLRAEGGDAVLTVADTGAGIAPEHLPRLFERFYRIEGAKGRTQEGTGIGLALVREVARLHGGEAWAESEPGVGSRFHVSLPFAVGQAPLDSTSAAEASNPFAEEALRWLPDGEEPRPATGAKARVLLADDNADMREYVRRLLSGRFEVVSVPDGIAALSVARSGFDLVLSDVMMPGLDGFGLLAALRADPATREVPVILLSARAGEEARAEGLEAGADDYLVKPFNARELVARVEGALALAWQRKQTLETLREADRRKDEFLAVLAHELRNPLAPIRYALQALKRSPTADQVADLHAMMERQAAALVRLVDDLLDVSRISRGKLELRLARIPLAEAVDAAVEASRPLLDEAGVSLSVALPAVPIWVEGDLVRLSQVFSNLLNNAAKFTPRGGAVRLTARVGSAVAVEVRDTGIGIPAEAMGRIFELFGQVDRSLEKAAGGLGIGLSLVRGIVGMHGGTVEATSEGEGKGAAFTVRLPLASAPPPAPHEPQEAVPVAKKSVLVVDDNQDSAVALKLLIDQFGHEARVAHSGEEALEMGAASRPDLILMDISMPGMSGYEACRRMRASWGAGVAILALTGFGADADREEAKRAGFDRHLTKPVDPEGLEGILSEPLSPR